MKKKEVILGVCGGIAAYRAGDIIRLLRKSNLSVTCIMTEEAERFVGSLTFQTLSGNRVYKDMFECPEVWDVKHISLAQRADVVLIAPATANIIGKLASGICDDLLTCVVMATKAPVLIAPAMNENMYRHRIVQENIAKLKTIGYKIIEPRRGELACGKIGVGCLAEVERIVREVKRFLK